MSGYRYEAINTERREIRLLVVHPSATTSDDIVHCSFKRISLLDTNIPEYNTISYTWGSDFPRARITVEGKTLDVPMNAEKAIRYFRLPDQDRVLWIDAACINQADDGEHGEKAPHVRYMSLVYSRSRGNLIHLGDDDDGLAGLAFKTVRYLRDNRLSMLDAIEEGSDEAKALTSLFSRPWFRRAWVVQEVVLGGHNRCFLGKHDILCRAFMSCALHVGLSLHWRSDAGQLADKFGPETAAAIENLITLRDVCEQYRAGIKDEPDIVRLIQRRRQCKNPRDMIYSIMGLWDPEVSRELPPRLEIRYHETVANVYRDTTRYSLESRNGPYILHHIAHCVDGDLNAGEFPTWVPRWDCVSEQSSMQSAVEAPSSLSVHFHCWHPWNALVKPKDRCEDSIPNVLRWDGILIDRIKAVTEPLDATKQRAPSSISAFIQDAMASAPSIFADTIAEVLIAGMKSPHKLATSEDYEPFTTFYEAITQLANSNDAHKKCLPQAIQAGEGRRRFYFQLVTACVWRRFYVTEHGHSGLAPRLTRPGDVVVALRNGMWPFVLRPIPSVPGSKVQYQFIGESFLRGFMQGEIVQQCEKGLRTVQPFEVL